MYHVQVKTQTPFVKLNAVTFPLSQLHSKDRKGSWKKIDYIYFLLTHDDKIYGSQKYSGQLYRCKTSDYRLYYQKYGLEDRTNRYIIDLLSKRADRPPRLATPLNAKIPGTNTPLLRLMHTFTPEQMRVFKSVNSSNYNTSGSQMYYDVYSTIDNNSKSNKGSRGEHLVLDYIRSQQGVSDANINPEQYDPDWDIQFCYNV